MTNQSGEGMKCPHCKKAISLETDDLTNRERDAYEYIVKYIASHERAPRNLDIIRALGVSEISKGYIYRILKLLQKKGYIELTGGYRGIKVVKQHTGEDK